MRETLNYSCFSLSTFRKDLTDQNKLANRDFVREISNKKEIAFHRVFLEASHDKPNLLSHLLRSRVTEIITESLTTKQKSGAGRRLTFLLV